MCGIFAYFQNFAGLDLSQYYNCIKHRGPDNTKFQIVKNDPLLMATRTSGINTVGNLFMVFHRLAINGLDEISDQPMEIENVVLICNGEIYNYKELAVELGCQAKYRSKSDCEVIIHCYLAWGLEQTLKRLDGVFAFVMYDRLRDVVMIARDTIGIRSLYVAINAENRILAVASECKALVGLTPPDGFIYQFPSASYWTSALPEYRQFIYYGLEKPYQFLSLTEDAIAEGIAVLLNRSVEKRLMSDRRICTLLSGGLDSSLVTALVAKHYPRGGVNTYAIGLAGSVDLRYARIVADYLGTRHTEIVVSEEEFLSAIEKTIYQIESFCTTTVRASVGNYLVSLYIREHGVENGGDTVVFCGDLSDELFGSYRGFGKAENETDFYRENMRLMNDVRYFDVLRSDKTISGAGLEARAPFEDLDLVDFVLRIPPAMKMFGKNGKMEKDILRKAFAGRGILPEEIIWRRKEAFSDGVSSKHRSWFQIIREYVDRQISDIEFVRRVGEYDYLPPYDKESLWYRMIFDRYFGKKMALSIPYYWRHPFSTNLDPSARLLDNY